MEIHVQSNVHGSYANIIVKSGVVHVALFVMKIIIEDKELPLIDSQNHVVFGRVRGLGLIHKLLIFLKQKGFINLSIRYVRGDWAHILCESVKACNK